MSRAFNRRVALHTEFVLRLAGDRMHHYTDGGPAEVLDPDRRRRRRVAKAARRANRGLRKTGGHPRAR